VGKAPGIKSEPHTFALDPDLSLGDPLVFAKAELVNFGVFLNSSH